MSIFNRHIAIINQIKIYTLTFICITTSFVSAQDIVVIGSQTWSTQNLNVEYFRNGESIPQATTMSEWVKAGQSKTPAWCYYDFESSNGHKLGKLYNWYAVNDSRGLAPDGWKIPSNQDWLQLKEFLGVSQNGFKLKSIDGWGGAPYAGNNETNFNGFPAGYISEKGEFKHKNRHVVFWTTTSSDDYDNSAYTHGLDRNQKQVVSYQQSKQRGFSVRCLKVSSSNQSQSRNNSCSSDNSAIQKKNNPNNSLEADNKAASFPGGQAALVEYFSNNIQYPDEARAAQKEGKVYVSFTISKDGNLRDIRVIKGPGFGLNKEAIRLLENMPKWSPESENGAAIETKKVLPLQFKLPKEN